MPWNSRRESLFSRRMLSRREIRHANSQAEQMHEAFREMPVDLESPTPVVHDLGRVTGATVVDPETFAQMFPNFARPLPEDN